MMYNFFEKIIFIDFTSKLKLFYNYIEELQLSVTSIDVSQCLDNINSHLQNAVLTCRATTLNSKSEIPVFPKPEVIHAAKKPKLQWKFNKTLNESGRKKNGAVFK